MGGIFFSEKSLVPCKISTNQKTGAAKPPRKTKFTVSIPLIFFLIYNNQLFGTEIEKLFIVKESTEALPA